MRHALRGLPDIERSRSGRRGAQTGRGRRVSSRVLHCILGTKISAKTELGQEAVYSIRFAAYGRLGLV
jgi:hypothetical protein